jgi:hypothetical protein
MSLVIRYLIDSYEKQNHLLGNHTFSFKSTNNGILSLKLFCPTVRQNCSSDREELLKLEAEDQELSKFLRSLEQFIQTVKGQNNFW